MVLRSSVLVALLAACGNHAIPTDRALEVTQVRAGGAATLPAHLRVAELNTEMKPAAEIAHALRDEPDLAAADLIILEEVHRDPAPCSGACAVGTALGFYATYAPGHVNGEGTDGVALLSRSPILSARVIELPYFDVHSTRASARSRSRRRSRSTARRSPSTRSTSTTASRCPSGDGRSRRCSPTPTARPRR